MLRLVAERNREVPGMVQLYTTLVASAPEDGHLAATEFASARFAALRASLVDQITLRQEDGRLRPDLDAGQVAALIIAAPTSTRSSGCRTCRRPGRRAGPARRASISTAPAG